MNDDPERNAMIPYLGKLVEIKDMAAEIKLFRVELLDGGREAFSAYQPGQFAFVSAFGLGEAPFGMASAAGGSRCLEFAVQRLGSVTTGLHELGVDDVVGVRGPLGNYFPMEKFRGKDLVVIGGGIGGAPLRPVIQTVLADRRRYGRLTILWAARHPSLLIFTDEFDAWRSAPDTSLYLTVDHPEGNWTGEVGLITQLLEKVNPSPENALAITCGPPVMIHYTSQLLEKLGFLAEQSYVTLEARMHCGLGKCGRCNLGEKLVCVDGPVFTMAQVGHLLEAL